MFDWLFLAVDRFGRSSPRGLAKRLNYIPPWAIRRLARAKLVRTLRHVWRNSPAQRERWQQAGLTLSDLRSPQVLTRIPFCDKKRLAVEPEAFFCVPTEKFTHVITTAGTTGEAKKLFFTTDDMDRQTRVIGTNLCRLPGASRVMVVFRLACATWVAGAVVRRGVEKAEMFGLLSSSQAPPEEQIKFIRDYKINVLMSSPSYIHRLTLEADTDLKVLGVKHIILSAQAWTEGLRAELQQTWGAKVLDAYATNECGCGIASECIRQDGLHVSEADFWIEIVDPETGEPLQDGQEGEVVVTTLSRHGMPLVRYRIGDLARLLPREGRCECGLPLRKLSRIKGRADNMLILGPGSNVFPDEFDRAILNVPGVTDYQLVIEHDGYKDVLHLTVESDMTGEQLTRTMTEALMSIKSVGRNCEKTKTLTIDRIQNVPHGVLSKDRPKSIRIIDNRPKTADDQEGPGPSPDEDAHA